MARKARVSKGKTMRPNFFVFCEGKTEIAYVELLRQSFRVPIQIIPRRSDSNISDKYIRRCKDEYVATRNDLTFVMFDLDVAGTLDRLRKLKDTILLVSNPCIEIWFLLHVENCITAIASEECVKRLTVHFKSIKRGLYTTMRNPYSSQIWPTPSQEPRVCPNLATLPQASISSFTQSETTPNASVRHKNKFRKY
jgi:hypothetical protein